MGGHDSTGVCFWEGSPSAFPGLCSGIPARELPCPSCFSVESLKAVIFPTALMSELVEKPGRLNFMHNSETYTKT